MEKSEKSSPQVGRSMMLNDFKVETIVRYRDETYRVRDNGAIYREKKAEKRKRPLDCIWTFGKENRTHPYLTISNERVHRIVAMAFHGPPPTEKHVVDHIDTNCRNNRPDNLRWLTRLENSLKNPITKAKIEYLCGSIDAFLENPSIINSFELSPSYTWMRSVTPEEAKNCKDRMNLRVFSPTTKKRTGSKPNSINYRRFYENKIFKPLNKFDAGFGREPGLDISKTLWCATYMFDVNYFPLCPDTFNGDRLNSYFEKLSKGKIFCYSSYSGSSYKVHESRMRIIEESIILLCKKSDGMFLVVGVELNKKNNWFIHYPLSSPELFERAQKTYSKMHNVPVKEFYNLAYKVVYK